MPNTWDKKCELDGRPAIDAREWTERKHDVLRYYAEMFSTGMKDQWDLRVYVDLYAGPGMVQPDGRDHLVRGSPLLALDVPYPFDRYIFAEKKPEYMEALRERVDEHHPDADVRYVPGDVNKNVGDILNEMPSYSRDRTVIAFGFVDPFDLAPRFETIRTLGGNRAIDFLHLLALGTDARRNFYATYIRENSDKIDEWLGSGSWREDWREAELSGDRKVIKFLAEKHAEAMQELGYLNRPVNELLPIHTGTNRSLYHLALYAAHERAYEFWDETKERTAQQRSLFD